MKIEIDRKDYFTALAVTATTVITAWLLSRISPHVHDWLWVRVPLWTVVIVAVGLLALAAVLGMRIAHVGVSNAGLRQELDQQKQATENQQRVARSAEEALAPMRERADQLAAHLDECRMTVTGLDQQVEALRASLRRMGSESEPEPPPREPI